MVNRVNLVINNGALYDFAPLSPGVCIVQGTIDSWPTKADAMTSGVNAGSFKSEGGLIPQTIRCASIYDTPDPSVKIVLFVKVPFAGSNMAKVRMMHTDIDVDEGLLDIMEKSYLYTSEHEVVAWIRGQRRTIKVKATIGHGNSPTATFEIT